VDWLDADGYWTARWLLERGVAVVYLIAFVAILDQWRGLLGERGLTPVRQLADQGLLRRRPTLFRWGYADAAATGLAWAGIGLAILVLVGVPQRGPAWLPMVVFLALWAIYLSFVEVGRVWYAFGWESLLLEAGFLVAFLGPADAAPPWLTLLLVRWLVFRVEFGAGLIKLRGDECWRRLTCLDHHHETQPLPNPLSRAFHHLPRPLHRVEVAANHLAQLVVPFGLFLPQPVAGISGTIVVLTQGYLLLSGNFAWLNLLTIVLATAAFSDAWFTWLPITAPADLASPPAWFAVAVVGLALVVVVLSLRGPVPNLLSPRQAMNTSHDPLRLVNSYGAFGTVTRVRHELEIEATHAADPTDPAARWEPYGFRAKPGGPRRRARQVAPYHLRLDWLMWFAAMDPAPTAHRWFQRLLVALLAGDPAVLRLLSHDPGGGRPPTAVRVVRYRYRFATRDERRRTGAWWVRDRRQVVAGPVIGPTTPDADG
jgi:hypothetical protein